MSQLGPGPLTPSQLSAWVTSKASSDRDFDSVYLLPWQPASVPAPSSSGGGGDPPPLYRYALSDSHSAAASAHFLTLSARGVNEFLHGAVAFSSLERWQREAREGSSLDGAK